MIQPQRFLILMAVLFLFSSNFSFSQSTSFHARYSTSSRIFMGKLQVKTKDNGSILAGKCGQTSDDSADVMLMKLDAYGIVQWSKSMATKARVENFAVTEMADGSIAFAVDMAFYINGVYFSDILLTKLNCRGEVLWSTRMSMNESVGKRLLRPMSLKEGINNDLILSFFATASKTSLVTVSRIDNAGAIVWNKTFYGSNTFAYYDAAAFYQDDKIFVFGFQNVFKNTGDYNKQLYGMRLNYDNGSVELQKAYNYTEFITYAVLVSDPKVHFDAEQLSDKSFALSGEFSNFNYTNCYFYKVLVNSDLSIRQSQLFLAPYFIGIEKAKLTVFPNGQTHLSGSNYDVETFYWYTADNSGNTIRSKKIGYPNSVLYGYYGLFQTGDNISDYFEDNITSMRYFIDVTQVNNGDNNITPCLGADTSFVTIQPLSVSAGTWNWASVNDNEVVASPFPINPVNINITTEYFCKPDKPVTPPFSIVGPVSVCSSGSFTFKVATTRSDLKPVQWKMSSDFFQSLQVLNDSTVAVVFKDAAGPYKAKLYASGGNCQSAEDSLTIDVSPTKNANLPRYVTVCTQNVTLHAGNWFKSYEWQDGSTDSVYTISKPGRYIVQLTSYCNEVIKDTIDAFSDKTGMLGNNSICKNDTTILHAPDGFLNYSWSPDYNAYPVSNNDIAVYPDKNMFYVLSSESPDGCKLRDTSYITIKKQPVVNLGPDTVVCVQEDLTLYAGKSFTTYAWNTGATSSTLVVTEPGIYSVKVTASNGCTASDTVNISSKVCQHRIDIPNAFTPNNDGKNDIFKVHAVGRMESFELTVFNRWGGVVFRTTSILNGWNGACNGNVQSTGTYIWMCKYKFINEGMKVQKGTVTLVK